MGMEAELDVMHDEITDRYSYYLYESFVKDGIRERGKLLEEYLDCGDWEMAYVMGRAAAICHQIEYLDVRAIERDGASVSVTHTLFPWRPSENE
jgi:hypothetical protein